MIRTVFCVLMVSFCLFSLDLVSFEEVWSLDFELWSISNYWVQAFECQTKALSFGAFCCAIGCKLLSAKQKLWALKHLVLELGASFWQELWALKHFLVLELGASFWVPNKSFELWSIFWCWNWVQACCVPNKSFELWSILLCNWVQAFECQRKESKLCWVQKEKRAREFFYFLCIFFSHQICIRIKRCWSWEHPMAEFCSSLDWFLGKRTKTKMSWKLSVCTRRRELGQG